jgi:PAS domain-containing protein
MRRRIFGQRTYGLVFLVAALTAVGWYPAVPNPRCGPRRAARLAVAAAFFALLFGLAYWQPILVTRERSRSRRAEDALREAEHKLRLLANNLQEMVLAFEVDLCQPGS